jgi:hypothetical protein
VSGAAQAALDPGTQHPVVFDEEEPHRGVPGPSYREPGRCAPDFRAPRSSPTSVAPLAASILIASAPLQGGAADGVTLSAEDLESGPLAVAAALARIGTQRD